MQKQELRLMAKLDVPRPVRLKENRQVEASAEDNHFRPHHRPDPVNAVTRKPRGDGQAAIVSMIA
ncbi:MAG: hypothetical protein DIU65_15925 [Proteobacteria bacterium]|nr:MAG: hypothetical protein DIU65_15925 [Pseudomonadota bacterium]